jgi:predicted ABC-type sugar transport system permease subunit
LPHLLCLWVGTAVAELVLYYLFLGQPYFRAIGVPFAVVVLVAAVVGTWRLLRPRTHADRRHADRRTDHRRAGE